MSCAGFFFGVFREAIETSFATNRKNPLSLRRLLRGGFDRGV